MKIFLGISSFQILAMFRRGLFYSYLSVYLRHFLGMTVTETTLFATLPMILNILCQRYLWGVLSDRYQKRRLLIIWGEILAGFGTLLVWKAHLLPLGKIAAGYTIIAGLSVIEVFWSMSNIGWSTLISDLYEKGQRSRIMGRLESLGGVGRILGVWSGGLLYDGFGLKYAGWGFYSGALFVVSAAAMFISVLPMLMVPEGGVVRKDSQVIPPLESPYPAWMFYGFLSAMVLVNFGRNSILVTLSQYFMLPTGFNLSSIALSYVVNIRSVAMVIAGLMTGWLSARLGNRRLLIWGTVVALASLIILGSVKSIVPACFSSFLMGFSDVVIMSSSYELAAALIPPMARARMFSLFNATYFLSWGIAGTCIAGPVVDRLIGLGYAEPFAYRVSFFVASGMILAGIATLGVAFVTHRRYLSGIH